MYKSCHGWLKFGWDPCQLLKGKKAWYILLPKKSIMNYCHGWLKLGWKNHLVSDMDCNNENV